MFTKEQLINYINEYDVILIGHLGTNFDDIL